MARPQTPEKQVMVQPQDVPDAVYQLKITLDGSKPSIWRRFTVQNTLTLEALHDIIQIVMGWENCHLYQFVRGKRQHAVIYTIPDPDFINPFAGMIDLPPDQDVRETLLKEALFEEKQKLAYLYDMGDSWEHTLLLEKILPIETGMPTYPVCLKAKGACPPEDFGGIWRYQDCIEALADKKHPRHLEYKRLIEEWLDGEFDPDTYDIEAVNRQLEKA